MAQVSGDPWEEGGWRGRLIIYTLAFTCTAVSLVSVAWASNQLAPFVALVASAAIGSPSRQFLQDGGSA